MTPYHHPEWLRQRAGENRDEWINRTNRSCFYCPQEFSNGWTATEHEIRCAKNPEVARRQA